MKRIKDKVIASLLLLSCLVLGGCPSAMDIEAVRNGDSFRLQIINRFHSYYNVEFDDDSDLPLVDISYEISNGSTKTAVFQLDGYNEKAGIGYKLVLADDKNEWDEKRHNGDEEAPDLSDEKLIQDACMKYDYPIIFLSAYEYQNDAGNEAVKNLNLFIQDLNELMESDRIKRWARETKILE